MQSFLKIGSEFPVGELERLGRFFSGGFLAPGEGFADQLIKSVLAVTLDGNLKTVSRLGVVVEEADDGVADLDQLVMALEERKKLSSLVEMVAEHSAEGHDVSGMPESAACASAAAAK